MLDGSEALGSYLRVQPCSDEVPHVSKCSLQWYRLSSEGSWREVISGNWSHVIYIKLLLIIINVQISFVYPV